MHGRSVNTNFFSYIKYSKCPQSDCSWLNLHQFTWHEYQTYLIVIILIVNALWTYSMGSGYALLTAHEREGEREREGESKSECLCAPISQSSLEALNSLLNIGKSTCTLVLLDRHFMLSYVYFCIRMHVFFFFLLCCLYTQHTHVVCRDSYFGQKSQFTTWIQNNLHILQTALIEKQWEQCTLIAIIFASESALHTIDNEDNLYEYIVCCVYICIIIICTSWIHVNTL